MSNREAKRAAMAAIRAKQNGGSVLAEDVVARERGEPALVDTLTQHTRPLADKLLGEYARETSGSSVGRAPGTEAAGSTPALTTVAQSLIRANEQTRETRTAAQKTAKEWLATDPEDPMPKIRFQSVTLHKAAPRHDGGRNRASTETTFFDIHKQPGIVIELDTATRLVCISKGAQTCYVPEHGVERFGPTLEDVAALEAERAAQDEKSRIANEVAAKEAAERAAMPAGV